MHALGHPARSRHTQCSAAAAGSGTEPVVDGEKGDPARPGPVESEEERDARAKGLASDGLLPADGLRKVLGTRMRSKILTMQRARVEERLTVVWLNAQALLCNRLQ